MFLFRISGFDTSPVKLTATIAQHARNSIMPQLILFTHHFISTTIQTPPFIIGE